MSADEPMRLKPLDVRADLVISVDGEEARLEGDGDTFILQLPSWRAGRALLRTGPFRGRQPEQLARLHTALKEADLTAEVRVSNETIARVGAAAQPGALSRLLRLGDAEVRPAAALTPRVRRRLRSTAVFSAVLAGLGTLLWFWKARR